jgi:6-phosphogluconolactonase
MNAKAALYSAVGEELTHYDVDVEGAHLVKRKTIKVPAVVQYAWPHPSKRYLYVATSNRGAGMKADFNHVSALRIDPTSGALSPHGEPTTLRSRAVHICVNPKGTHVLSAHNLPQAGITVNQINHDGTIGPEVRQPEELGFGIYPHQVMMTPSNRTVILVDRGNSAAEGRPEDPGALRLFRFNEGALTKLASIAPNGGYGFGPRHLDFHPTQPWVYVSLERQSKLYVYRMRGDGLEPEAAFICDSLADRENIKPRQLAGTIHVHPNGRFVYLANRADWTVDYEGKAVFGGGENSIVVYAIDAASGEPTLIQRIDPRSVHVRTFAIDPSGRLLVTASIKPLAVREGTGITTMPAALSVFRIGADGKLEFARKYDVETNGKIHYWMGML